jgi:hypothetical protein
MNGTGNVQESCAVAVPVELASGKWQPIESAPRDGTPVLGYSTEGVMYACWYFERSWLFFRNHRGDRWAFHPTHWMPLPEPPK